MNLTNLTPAQILALHAKLGDELRDRGIKRSSNNPTGDLAEYLLCKAFGWTQSGNSHANADAVAPDGKRYQIKGRRLTRLRQLSAIRDLQGGHFDFLAVVLFNEDYTVQRAALIPYSIAIDLAKFVQHTNSHKFMLRDDVWSADGVKDVTKELQLVTF
ncbi:MAG TPA: hypothetical protein VFW94_16860 [Candidatus Acidoferrales bacterium]|nr:hypothetical protein [Candidatus Acidoferrales bacterium]